MAGPSKRRFDQIYREGRRTSGKFLRLHVLEGVGLVGIATARAIGNRPQRNRQRRRLQAALRSVEAGALSKWDVVLSLNSKAPAARFAELKEDLIRVLEKACGRSESA